MKFAFERFVARRYLTAKRRQAVISVITVVSIIGVAAGVMALIETAEVCSKLDSLLASRP